MGARGYGLTAPAGALRFELMTIEILHLRLAARAMLPVLLEAREELRVRWELEHPFEVE